MFSHLMDSDNGDNSPMMSFVQDWPGVMKAVWFVPYLFHLENTHLLSFIILLWNSLSQQKGRFVVRLYFESIEVTVLNTYVIQEQSHHGSVVDS